MADKDVAFRPALVIVDVQEDFCPPNGSLAIPDARSIVPTINALLALPFTAKIATQDWHPPDHISFASSHPDAVPFSTAIATNPLNPGESETITLWPPHCIQHTPGAALLPALDAAALHRVVRKGHDARVEMFSAFRASFRDPPVCESELLTALRDAGVTHVFVAGLAMDVCVKFTALHAAEAGFVTAVLVDAARASDQSDGAMQRLGRQLKAGGVRVTDSGCEEIRRLAESS